MKKELFIAFVIIAGLAITLLYVNIGMTATLGNLAATNLRMEILEDFEDTQAQTSNPWTVFPSRMGEADTKYVKGGPAILKVRTGEKKEYVLGVKAKFKWPGYNWVQIKPPKPLTFKGQVKNISIWVCGRNNKWNLEVWVKDWKGTVHILKWGSLKFFGWKRLTTVVPVSIPQAVDSYPPMKQLKLTAIYLRADPTEPVFDADPSEPNKSDYWYYVFFDHITYITELPDVEFDGVTLDAEGVW